MVKADPKRDYYADLELAQGADADEIRKQYRKLALKYHPDRNPGREEECVPKFQAIQTAHEILVDPEQRRKYDAQRRKHGQFTTTMNAPRGNPYSASAYAATAQFGVPPRRTASTRAQPNSAQFAQNGANRFAQFPKPPSYYRAGPNFKDDLNSRAEAWNAWQNLNKPRQKAEQGQRSHQRAPPETAEAFYKASRSSWSSDPTSKPKTNWGHPTKATPKKAGYDPTAPGADEPPANTASNMYTRHMRPPPPRVHSEVPPAPTAKKQGFFNHSKAQLDDDVPFTEGRERMKSSYGFSSGEKTYIDSDALRRSASTKTSPRPPGPNEQSPLANGASASSTRHRSASPSFRQPFPDFRIPKPTPPKPGNKSSHARRGKGGNATRPFFMSSSDEDSGDGSSPPSKNNLKNQPGPQSKSDSAGRANGAQGRPQARQRPPTTKLPEEVSKATPESAAKKGGSTIFTFPVSDDMFAPQSFKSRSTENIKFSPGDWHGKFEGMPDYFASPMPTKHSRSRSRTSPVRGQPLNRSPTATHDNADNSGFSGTPGTNGVPDMAPPQPFAAPQNSESSPSAFEGGVRFSKEQWEKTFKEPNWLFSQPKPPSPTRSGAAGRRPKAPKPRAQMKGATVPKPVNITDVPDESEIPQGATSNAANGTTNSTDGDASGLDDTSAMDIDVEVPVNTELPPAPSSALDGEAGAKPQEPGVVPDPPQTRPSDPVWPQSPTKKPARPVLESPLNPASEAQTLPQKSASAADDLSLGDLKNITPLAPSAEGLRNLNDLNSALPFESQSSSHPTKSFAPNQLQLPPPPKAPPEPSRLTHQSWNNYVRHMQAYNSSWSNFNRTMLDHFSTRQRQAESITAATLAAVGDPASGHGGFSAYLQGLREDERVRMHWNVSFDKHKVAMENFAKLREQVLNRGLLSESVV